ncbi:hypothetical protein EPUS_04287 [Endocarpon pusillum Z07020]|uniref:Uncharacterized protein n=1 Tax=Endocarpon pusillum (strain Z07020 / HMAS-L-300199) TaxID=1263415 RepID=U1G665_ENDPU|nr:uncharacterized protein EPUS_04287 [Endocarpon pusillum Z07020]ERF72852.1 hypothetical protein EPUS_04287 [Endocarpon pusillum Z07020]
MSVSSQQFNLHPPPTSVSCLDALLSTADTPSSDFDQDKNHNLMLFLANGNLPEQEDEYTRAPQPPQPTSGDPSILFAPPPHPHRPPINAAYRHPLEASAALQALRTAEREATYACALQGLPTTRGRSPTRTHSPTFPYNEYPADLCPTFPDHCYASFSADFNPSFPYHCYASFTAIERAENKQPEEKDEEVYVIPASQALFATDSEAQTRCGKCLFPLHWGDVLPSRCQQRECRAVNLGPDWAANERFRQAMGLAGWGGWDEDEDEDEDGAGRWEGRGVGGLGGLGSV